MKFLHEPLAKAGKQVVEELRRNGGFGGLISLDERGHGVYQYPASDDCIAHLLSLSLHTIEQHRNVQRSHP